MRPLPRQTDRVSEGDPLPPDDRAVPPTRPALEQLYRDQAARLRRFFSRRAPPDEAEDLTHEVFKRFAGRQDAPCETIAEPGAYLSRVATNLLRDRAKFAVRRAVAHHKLLDDERSQRDPISALETRDGLRRLEAAVAKLRPWTREVFLLNRIEGLTYGQVAARTGLSKKAVKKHMAMALFELRRDIGHD